MRALPIAIATLLLLLPTSVRADDVPRLAAEDLELIPLHENKKNLLFLRHAELIHPLAWRAREVAKSRARIAKQGGKGPKAEQERKKIQRLEAQMKTALEQLEPILRAEGITDEVLRGLKGFPPGPRRAHRFAHSLVLDLETLDPQRRALLRELVSAVDGAQLALIALRKRHERATDEGKRQRIQAMNQQLNRIEGRFWRAIDFLLDRNERAKVRSRLPHGVSRIANPLGHALRLPGLTASQGARLNAIVAEVESETAADQAEARRLQAKVKQTPQAERKPLQDQTRQAQLRVAERVVSAGEAGKALLSPAQWEAFQAIPPFVSPNDRRQDVTRLLQGMDLTEAQQASVAGVRQRIQAARQELQADMRHIGQMSQDFGPDSPQMQSMNMMRMGVEAEGHVVARSMAREVFVEVLTPGQVIGWVVGLYNDR